MNQSVLAGEGEMGNSGVRTVVVGVKLESQSKELLTWALVKVAQPGDLVIALHVLSNNEIVDRDGKSCLLSLVKAFDSVLAVYEGFCNLKQVDLKFKVCRGSSIRKILVQEAKAFFASEVIVGTARKHHKIRSSASVAKYCAKKLPKDCSVLAVDYGKVVFRREASLMTNGYAKGGIVDHRHRLLSALQRSLIKNPKILHVENADDSRTASDKGHRQNLELTLVKAGSDCSESGLKQNCSICSADSILPENSCVQSAEEFSGDEDKGNSMALVALQKVEAAPSLISLLIRELPEPKPGWPLLQRAISSDQLHSKGHSRKISVVQWAMQLPSRHCLSSDSEQSDCKSGAIVPVGAETLCAPSSPRSSRSLPQELEGLHEKYSAICRLFKYHELLRATSNFIPENLIGKGGSSQVYRGCLPDGKEIAVKILKPSEDVLKEFVLEIDVITSLHHKNIISLFGFCFEDGNVLLVYDFLSRGSVEENLHGNKDSHTFGWSERYKVAVGVAEALEYLHNASAKPVIHRDVKSSNILLSYDFEPQLSDFGLAKWASTTSSHITCTDVAGTFGYLAPEYFMFGKVNDKIDVYAFGVVLLELLSGRKPISNDHPKGQESLVMWAKPILNGGKVAQLLDPSLANDYDCDQMERVALAATLCIRRAPRARPQMSIVLKLLQGDPEVTKWARLQVNASEETDTPDDEAFPSSNIQSHLNLALLDTHEDSLSMSSIEQTVSLEDYLRGRWSCSSSLD
ncbi:kinase with adenine nucleotide alpha hydrolases-like domain-containing protein [Actinidia rufa]|uniref:Kinase with adenine nucleotide alpha hydrolases-like domain-containing protein n=1 Tax=Actinidia rufa TaxID=165716 RepID=A0A7J0FCW8_9ERIC|nr:kinase with adenine nucleotide alpha hydrolases-like domain-containing protein [Actinidia rufa]